MDLTDASESGRSTAPLVPAGGAKTPCGAELVEALCDLVDGDTPPAAGVSVSGASWDVGEALEAAAARRGIPADAAYYPVTRRARVVLRAAHRSSVGAAARRPAAPSRTGALLALFLGALLVMGAIVATNPAAALALLVIGVANVGLSYWLEGPGGTAG